MLSRAGALRRITASSRPLGPSAIPERLKSTRTFKAGYKTLPLVPIEEIGRTKKACIPLLPIWEKKPLAVRLSEASFNPNIINDALNSSSSLRIEYIAKAFAAASELGRLSPFAADALLNTAYLVELKRISTIVKIREGKDRRLKRVHLLFAQDYLWHQHSLLKKKQQTEQQSASKSSEEKTIPSWAILPDIPKIELESRIKRHRVYRVVTDTETERFQSIRLRNKAVKQKKSSSADLLPSVVEPVGASESKPPVDADVSIQRGYDVHRKLVLSQVLRQAVSPPVVPTLESTILPILRKHKLDADPLIKLRLAMIYSLDRKTRIAESQFEEALASLSTTTNPTMINVIFSTLLRSRFSAWCLRLVQRLDRLGLAGNDLTSLLRLCAISRYSRDNDAFSELKSRMLDPSNTISRDQTARNAFAYSALFRNEVKIAADTILTLSKDLHTRNMRPLDWGGQRDEQLLWKFLFLGFERVRDSALAPILKHCWQYYTSLKLTPTSHMVAAVIRGLNTPHQFQNIVSSLDIPLLHPRILFAQVTSLAEQKQFAKALEFWEAKMFGHDLQPFLTRAQALKIVALCRDQPNSASWFRTFLRFLVVHQFVLKLHLIDTQRILFNAVLSLPSFSYAMQVVGLFLELSVPIAKSIRRKLGAVKQGMLQAQADTNLSLHRNSRFVDFSAASPVTLFSNIIRHYFEKPQVPSNPVDVSTLDRNPLLVDVFLTPGILSQEKSLSDSEMLLIRKYSSSRKRVAKIEEFKQTLRGKLTSKAISRLRPFHLRNKKANTLAQIVLPEFVIETFSYSKLEWLVDRLQNKAPEIEAAITSALRDRRSPSEIKFQKQRAVRAMGISPIQYGHFLLNPTSESPPSSVKGTLDSPIWTVRCKTNAVTFLGQGPSMSDAIFDMCYQGLNPEGDLFVALGAQALPFEERSSLMQALVKRREQDSHNHHVLEALQRIEDAKSRALADRIAAPETAEVPKAANTVQK